MEIGQKIKSFKIVKIVNGYSSTYDEKGRKTQSISKFLFLLSDDGQERVLQLGKKSLNDCKTYCPTFGHKHKFIKWNQFEIIN
jgi:hypothetical protein